MENNNIALNNATPINSNEAMKMEALLGALRQVISEGDNNLETMSNEIGEIALALSKAQAGMEKLIKSTRGHDYYYAELAKCIEVSRQALADNDLCVTQLFKPEGKSTLLLVTIIAHKSGQWFKSYFPIEKVPSNRNNTLQQTGCGITYIRRYSYNSIVGLSQEDDDGKSAISNDSGQQTKKIEAPAKSPEVTALKELVKLCTTNGVDPTQFANSYKITRTTDVEVIKNYIEDFESFKERFLNAA
jgi:hypothetical protein